MNAKLSFSAFGFPIYVQTSALLVTAYLAFVFTPAVGLAMAVALFGSILVHELGHSFAFRRYGTESHIVIHMFGGHSAPHLADGLTDGQHVKIAAAGPLTALVLLGIPAFLYQRFGDPANLIVNRVAYVLVLFNVWWGMINLLPIWPLDGGHILYYGSRIMTGKDQWPMTRIVTIVFSVIAAIVGYFYQYPFVMLFAAYNAYQVFNSPGPRGMGDIAGGRTASSPVSAAAQKARSQQPATTKVNSNSASEILGTSYEWIIKRRWDKAAAPIEALMSFPAHQTGAKEAIAWHHLLDNNGQLAADAISPNPPSPLMTATWNLMANPTGSVEECVREIRSVVPGVSMVPALMIWRQLGRLEEICTWAGNDGPGYSQIKAVEQVVLHQGLVQEQIAVTSALHTLDNQP